MVASTATVLRRRVGDTLAAMGKKQSPECVFLQQGGRACQIDLPKPNQLCSACRPWWARAKVKRIVKG